MHPFSSELPFHICDWLIISLKDFCIVIRKWPTFLPSTSRVKVNNTLSDSCECRNCLRRGESLSPVSFARHISDALTDHKMNILLYADDLVIIENTRLNFQRKLGRLHQYCVKKCLSVNIKKSTILVTNSTKLTGSFRFSTDTLKEVDLLKDIGLQF